MESGIECYGQEKTQELFQAHMRTLMESKLLHRHLHSPIDSSDEEIHQMEDSDDCGLDLEEVRVSDTFALSDIRQPQAKQQKTHHLTPVTTAFIDA